MGLEDMSFRLIVTPAAEKEIDEAIAWYENQSPGLGERFTHSVKMAFDEIQSHPERCGFSRSGTRRLKLDRFPYEIHFLVFLDSVSIIAVFHERRNPETLRKRLS